MSKNIPFQIVLKVCLTLCLFWCNEMTYSQYWMQKGGGATIDEAADVAMDPSDNAYSVGYFTGFGSFGPTFLNATGSTDILITKTLNNGSFAWAKKAGGPGSDKAEAVVVDASGNVFVTGYFTGTATFGTTSITSNGLQDIFVAKYNTSGTLQWVVEAGGSASDFGFGIDVNSAGDIFITGSFKGTATFSGHSVTSANLTSDIFVAKLNASGVFQWVESGTGNYPNLGRSLGTDDFGNVYVTGQFSDTLTFDQTHNNQSQNIVFLVKFDSTGTEKWFTTLGGAISNVATDMAVDAAGNCFLTGDFDGILSVYDIATGVASSISSTYPKTIFTAKYDSAGMWQQKRAFGSNNAITSQSIAVDATGNYYIGGHFECDFTEFSDTYGDANFLSMGDEDVFVSKIDANGTWNYSRHIGGVSIDRCYGVGVSSTGEIHAVGSFENSLNVPVSSSFSPSNVQFWTPSGCATNNGYCGDLSYGSYRTMSAQGNKDMFILNGFDVNREPLDYFMRSGSSCVRDIPDLCISNCVDTIFACEQANLSVNAGICVSITPSLTYVWSNGSSSTSSVASTTGYHSVTVTHGSGCFSWTDSIYVVIHLKPAKPHISDGKHFNTQDVVTTDVQLCSPDTTLLTGGGFGINDSIWWSGGALTGNVYDSTVIVSTTGTYTFTVKNEHGCIESNNVLVKENLPLPPFNLQIEAKDTLEVCFPDAFTIQLYDSISNPSAAANCLSNNVFTVFSTWQSVPTLPYLTFCDTYGYFDADSSGTFTIYDTTVRFNYCYRDTHTVSKTVFVEVNPKPIVQPFPLYLSGNTILCPGGSTDLHATGGPNYTWFGPGVSGSRDSTVSVIYAGQYTVQSTQLDTNSYGCVGQFSISNTIQVTLKPQPTITASDYVICPNSSVTLTSSSSAGNAWEGPNGPVAGGSTVTVTDPGQYFTVVNDADSCGLVSNTITLYQYTTPKLIAVGDTVLCPGASTLLTIQANSGATVTWNAPLSGTNPVQVITSPGTYSCSIVSCNITTTASITIHAGNPAAQIVPQGVLCADSSVVLEGPPGMVSYTWMPNNDTTQNITVTDSGTYTLSIVDAQGCAGTSPPFTISKIDVNSDLLNTSLGYCHGDQIELFADTNQSPNGTYYWLPGGQTTPSIVVSQPGSYSLNVSDTNGCLSIGDPFIVNESDSSTTVLQVGDSVICERDTVWLNPVIQGFTSYVWMPGNISVMNYPVTETGTYALVATDSSGCVTRSDSFSVLVNDAPISGISSNGVLCADSSLVIEGIPGLTSYQWLPGNQTTPNITITQPGLYELIVTDTNGCTSVPYPYLVNQITVPVAITNSFFGFCEGDSLTLTGNPGMASYLWMPSGDTGISYTQNNSGQVSLSVVDTNGCKAMTGPVQITQSSLTTSISVNGKDTICEGDTALLSANNTLFNSYQWNPGNEQTQEISVYESGVYWMVAIDSAGCITTSDSIQVVVVENDLPIPTVNVDSIVCVNTPVMYAADGGGETVYWYKSLNGSPVHIGDTLVTTIETNSSYYLQTIAAPCASAFNHVVILAEECEEPEVSNVFSPNGDGINDGWGIEIMGATCYEVEIYNRWGLLIYTLESNGQYWDGTIEKSGMEAPDGTYYYILNYCDHRNVPYSQRGYITLAR